MKHNFIALAVVLLASAHQSIAAGGNRGVTVTLSARWASTATILEAAEYLADDSPSQFWNFVDAWTSRDSVFEGNQDCLSHATCWESILAVAGKHTSAGLATLLPAVLGSRKYSPRLEVFASLAAELSNKPEACCWVDVHGQQATTEAEVSRLLSGPPGKPPPQLYTSDHVYNTTQATADTAGAQQNLTVAVLYGAIGTSCFPSFHSQLSKAAHSPGVKYVLRPVLSQQACRAEAAAVRHGGCGGGCVMFGSSGLLQLPGFGVEMAIKNMEYSALDDSKSKQEAAEAEADALSTDTHTEGFLFSRLLERRPGARSQLLAFREALLASASHDQKLKVWDLKDLGLQAAQQVVAAADPVATLVDVAQNFPMLASPLSRLEVSKEIRAAVAANAMLLPTGSTYLLLNGQFVDTSDMDLFSLLDLVQQEVRLGGLLQETGLAAQDVGEVLTLRAGAVDDSASHDTSLRIDIGPSSGGTSESASGEHAVWLNDLERDIRYATWPTSLQDLLQPSFGGQLPLVGRNMMHVTIVADLARTPGLLAAAAAAKSVEDGWPIRVGLLPPARLATADAAAPWATLGVSVQASLAVAAISKELGGRAALLLVARLAEAAGIGADADISVKETNLTSAQVEAEFSVVWRRFSAGGADVSIDDNTLASLPDMTAGAALDHLHAGTAFAQGMLRGVIEAAGFAKDKGLRGSPLPTMTMNGAVVDVPSAAERSVMTWRQLLVTSLQHEMRQLQEWVYYGKIKESKLPLLPQILRLSGAVPRHNPHILPTAASNAHSSATGPTGSEQRKVTASLVRAFAGMGQSPYLHQPATLEEVKAATHWVVVDVSKKNGLALAREAVKFINGGSGDAAPSRLALVHNPEDIAASLSPLQLVMAAAAALPARRQKLPGFLQMLLTNATLAASLAGGDINAASAVEAAVELAASQGLNDKVLRALLADSSALTAAAASASAAVRDTLGLPQGASAVVTNGRVLHADADADDEEGLVAGDFALLQAHAVTGQYGSGCVSAVIAALDGRRIPPLQGGREDEEPTSEQLSDIVAQASSILASSGSQFDKRSSRLAAILEQLDATHVSVAVPHAESATSPLQATVLVDPLSKAAQKLAPLLAMLREHTGIGLRLIMNPAPELSDLPLKSYYRYAIPTFSGGIPEPPAAVFEALPGRQVLTLNMDVPEAWLVEAVQAQADLDNLKLSELPQPAAGDPTLHAKFQLEALLLTGQCIDRGAATRQQMTPRGVQLWAGRGKEMHLKDTLVMANLGYFQMQTSPGAWTLHLAPGRSQELYHVTPDGLPSKDGAVSTPALVDSLQGHHILLRVRKNEGKEDEDVLDSKGTSDTSKWSKFFNGSSREVAAAATQGDEDERVHVFTIASGHMYERLQKIMILSVLRNTKSRLKVWFIKNYMSPQMRAFVPHMAKHYGFDFELVTYKWPSWLHKQTDKQRIIWAYKILFLDVLFPLDLKKVIFLDADQIIRTDIKELADLDLEGAPYGYTPFCDNNKEMDGFRFWRQGFWKNHLRGRPYHISALYVIDLVRFRQTAAGDQLRVIYDQLSKDPNSLSNLDQDLPNYAQHQVKIFSLPQQWLWCETWCGNTTKAAAKTIDLCNNPLTKEPKLDNARRIVAEWPALDEEARNFTAQVERQLAEADDSSSTLSVDVGRCAVSALTDTDHSLGSSAASSETVSADQTRQCAARTAAHQASEHVEGKQQAGGTLGNGPQDLTEETVAVGQTHAPHLKALKDQVKSLRDKMENAKASEDYKELSPGKQALLRRRMDLAAKCVLKKQQEACVAIELLPELADVTDDTDPLTFLTAQEIVESEAEHQRKTNEAEGFLKPKQANKAMHDEL